VTYVQACPGEDTKAAGMASEGQGGFVSIIIPNWNGKHFLKDCLDSLITQSYKDLEIIVVDNGSKDGSLEFLRDNYPQVRVPRFEKNTGFSVAVNRGIRESKGEYIALINNDTVVDGLWVEELVKALNAHPEIGSVGCKMLGYDDRTLLDGVGDGYRRGGLPGRIGHREKDTGLFDSERYILGACGGAAMYRRAMFVDIGLFDEDYFAYLEDVDMGLRAQSAGYKCLYVPTAIIYHLGCGTTGSGYSPLVVRLSSQNNFNTLIKNIPGPLLVKFIPQICFWQAYYLAVVCVRGGRVLAWFEGFGRFLLLLPRMLKKRQAINKGRRVSLDYLEEIIVQSERDLEAARMRLNKQALEERETKVAERKAEVDVSTAKEEPVESTKSGKR
jgi:GT2 family glycosyltransferase